MDFKYIYITPSQYGGFSVKGVSTYEDSSVLAGQDKVVFLDNYETVEDAQKEYPEADYTHPLLEPQNTFDHLPDNGDGW